MERRDEIRGEAALVMQTELVNQTVSMWKEHAESAAKIRRLALEKIERDGFDSSSSAIQAIKWAQEEERKTRGAEAFIEAIKNSPNEDLIEKARRLVERQLSTDGDSIDAETQEVDNSADAEPDN